jgi:hypothetical protein
VTRKAPAGTPGFSLAVHARIAHRAIRAFYRVCPPKPDLPGLPETTRNALAALLDASPSSLDAGRFLAAAQGCFALLAQQVAHLALFRPGRSAMRELPSRQAAMDRRELCALLGLQGSASLFEQSGIEGFFDETAPPFWLERFDPDVEAACRELLLSLGGVEAYFTQTNRPCMHDLLKEAYLALVPTSLRHALGEYYTPAWLAEWVLGLLPDPWFRAVGAPNLESSKPDLLGTSRSRLLDPTCGSGTFLVAALSSLRSHRAFEQLGAPERLRDLLDRVVGFEINPLAVLAARTSYLCAIRDLVGQSPLRIPVLRHDPVLDPIPKKLDAFDLVAGNPPWVGWEHIPEAWRKQASGLWAHYGLFVHGAFDAILGKGRKDLSTLVTLAVMDRYLKPGGTLGFVITQSVWKSTGAAQGFRRFQLPGSVPFRVRRVDDLSALPVFAGATTRTTVFVATRDEEQVWPVPYVLWRPRTHERAADPLRYNREEPPLRAILASTETLLAEAWPSVPADGTSAWAHAETSSWKDLRALQGPSDYTAHAGAYSGGANAVYWFERLRDVPPGMVSVRNIVDGAKRQVPSEVIELEAHLLHPLLRLRDLRRWHAEPGCLLLLVQDPGTRKGLSLEAMADCPAALGWLSKHEALLRSRASWLRFYVRRGPGGTLHEIGPFWSMFAIGDYTLSRHKVAWGRLGSRLDAAVLTGDVIPQETLTLVACGSEQEACFVAGVVNSARFGMAARSASQTGGKSFGTPKLLATLRIPRFDADDATHQALAACALRCVEAVRSGQVHRLETLQAEVDRVAARLWDRAPPDEST